MLKICLLYFGSLFTLTCLVWLTFLKCPRKGGPSCQNSPWPAIIPNKEADVRAFASILNTQRPNKAILKTNQTESNQSKQIYLSMDFHLKQWRNQHEESGQQPSAKMPKLLMDPHQPQRHLHSSGSAAFPLFLPEPSCKTSNLSAFHDSNTAANTRLPSKFTLWLFLHPPLPHLIKESFMVCFKCYVLNLLPSSILVDISFFSFCEWCLLCLLEIMRNYFSLEQWQELELQALIYRFMLAGAAIPAELLQPIKKTLLHSHSPPYFLNHPLQLHCSYYQPSCKRL